MKEEFSKLQAETKSVITQGQDDMKGYVNDQEMSFVVLKQGILRELSESESRNTDIIDEMNQMNVEIKKRG